MNEAGKTVRLAATMVVLAVLAGCAKQLEGTYSGEDAASGERTGFLDSLTFLTDNRVEATFLGETRSGTYRVDGDQVTVMIGNDGSPEVLKLTDGDCLVGMGIAGKYCKTGRATAAVAAGGMGDAPPGNGMAPAGAGSADPASIVGNYEARDPATGQGMHLEFDAGRGVTLTMLEPGAPPESGRASYVVEGDRVTLMNDTGVPMVFRRDGNALVFTDGAESIRLERQ